MSKEEYTVTRNDCGIGFSFSEKIEQLWRDNHKTFYCPNGHPLAWKAETPTYKEHKERLKEVEELKAKLVVAVQERDAYKKQLEELQFELEIWKPSDKKEVNDHGERP